jgi:uncharacterized iron-regulated membrane protein
VRALASRKTRPAPSIRRRWYKFWLNIHLYSGLSIGLVFVLAGLTGSMLVFYVELDEILNPELQISEAQAKQAPKPLETVFQVLKVNHPDRNGAWRLEMPRHSQAMIMARYYKAKEKEHLHFAPLIAWVNPYTAEVASSRFWGDYVMTWIYDLHYELLLDKTGKIVMGITGLFLLFSLVAGIYLWWPKLGKLKPALTFKPNASKKRFNYDLHKVSGVYGFTFLLLLLMSGFILELPDYVNPVINKVSPLYQQPSNLTSLKTGSARISLDQAVSSAQNRYPNAVLRWVETPQDAKGTYRIQFYQDGEPSRRFPKTMVWLDQYSGKILAVHEPETGSSGDTFLSWMHPLHSGEIAGMSGRIAVFISGLFPLILFYTGLIRWLQKRRARQKKLPL